MALSSAGATRAPSAIGATVRNRPRSSIRTLIAPSGASSTTEPKLRVTATPASSPAAEDITTGVDTRGFVPVAESGPSPPSRVMHASATDHAIVAITRASAEVPIQITAGARPTNSAARRAAASSASARIASRVAGAALAAITRSPSAKRVSVLSRRSSPQKASTAPGGWPRTWVGYDEMFSRNPETKPRGLSNSRANTRYSWVGSRRGLASDGGSLVRANAQVHARDHAHAPTNTDPKRRRLTEPAHQEGTLTRMTPTARSAGAKRKGHCAVVNPVLHVPLNGGASR